MGKYMINVNCKNYEVTGCKKCHMRREVLLSFTQGLKELKLQFIINTINNNN